MTALYENIRLTLSSFFVFFVLVTTLSSLTQQ